jgi:hypothetical protein
VRPRGCARNKRQPSNRASRALSRAELGYGALEAGRERSGTALGGRDRRAGRDGVTACGELARGDGLAVRPLAWAAKRGMEPPQQRQPYQAKGRSRPPAVRTFRSNGSSSLRRCVECRAARSDVCARLSSATAESAVDRWPPVHTTPPVPCNATCPCKATCPVQRHLSRATPPVPSLSACAVAADGPIGPPREEAALSVLRVAALTVRALKPELSRPIRFRGTEAFTKELGLRKVQAHPRLSTAIRRRACRTRASSPAAGTCARAPAAIPALCATRGIRRAAHPWQRPWTALHGNASGAARLDAFGLACAGLLCGGMGWTLGAGGTVFWSEYFEYSPASISARYIAARAGAAAACNAMPCNAARQAAHSRPIRITATVTDDGDRYG